MLNPGQSLQGRYRIVMELGRGGMGAVYKAEDTRLNIFVALKEFTAQNDLDTTKLQDLREQFKQEATILARLSHPHLVSVTDFFQEGRNVYLVMQFVDGLSLSDIIKRDGALREDQVLIWTTQLLDAVAYCHSNGIIHRDIKPQNIIIKPDGQAVLVDFGLVKLWNPNDPRTRTAVRGIGTPQYAPPEQYESTAGHTDPRSDLFSLGATMYHALTGQSPPTATLRIASPEEFKSIRSMQHTVSSRTAAAIERAMELARSKRWNTSGDMATGLGVQIKNWGTGRTYQEKSQDNDGKTDTLPGFKTDGLRGQAKQRQLPVWAWVLGVGGAVVIGGGVLIVAGILLFGLQDPIMAMFKPAMTPTLTPVSLVADLPTNTLSPSPDSTVTLEPTATLTASDTPTMTPSATTESSPAATLTPTPSSTPTFTLTPTPTQTPQPTAEPANTNTPGITPSATVEVVASGTLISFESFGSWRRGDQPYGEFIQSQDQVKDGAFSAKLTYDFPQVADDYVVFSQVNPVSGQPTEFSAWVYGDGSGQFLNLWIQDANDEMWSVHMGVIPGAGWKKLTGKLAPDLPWPNGHIYGPENGKVDYPVRFYAFVLDRPADGPGQGVIYIDTLSVQ